MTGIIKTYHHNLNLVDPESDNADLQIWMILDLMSIILYGVIDGILGLILISNMLMKARLIK